MDSNDFPAPQDGFVLTPWSSPTRLAPASSIKKIFNGRVVLRRAPKTLIEHFDSGMHLKADVPWLGTFGPALRHKR